ncbi:hypothetical protein JOE61_003868 [Nocardioides salarius]|uniref:Uncharacterized protein n=1 Tax=Nocardioides salarius TaxID=374513 RepID=A0ABS2MFT3_9ACTN|nr:hypothetical protein [Nocardioides salarius]MBM7510054.1 hypothetical protein [Nocardioides salarius]
MGFSNPAQPINYDLIAQAVADVVIDYAQVRAAVDEALVSTDDAVGQVRSIVQAIQGDALGSADVLAAAEAALVSTDAAIASLSAILSDLQPAPDVPSWAAARVTALGELVAIQAAYDAATARGDASPEAAAVLADLETRAAALWATVKP